MSSSSLLDLLTVQLPASGEAVEAWAGEVIVHLVSPAHNFGHPLVPSVAWQALLRSRWPEIDLTTPVSFWAQALAYTWASEPAPIHGSVERALNQAWSRVLPHSWPQTWPVSALEMALEMGWQKLPETMLSNHRPGWRHPPLTLALRKRLNVSSAQFEALKALLPDETTQSVWKRASLATEMADIEDLQGQDVTVPAQKEGDAANTWPEWEWSDALVTTWPAMHKAMGRVRAPLPSAQAQHVPAGRALVVRALALGQMGVAHQLGWSDWLTSDDPLIYRTGPHAEIAYSVLDGLAQGYRLATPNALNVQLDHVFQAAHQVGRPVDWSRPDDLDRERCPALRFWGRTLSSGFQLAQQDRQTHYPGRRSPAWWRFAMQERTEVWQAWWSAIAPTAFARWELWWHAVDRRTAALNPWHLLAATRLPAARALLGGSPWAVLSGLESRLVTRCLDRLMHDAVANNERWKQADVHWAMISVAQRWRQGDPASQPWVWLPLIWAWLSALDMAPDEDQPLAQRWARPWWRRLSRWASQDPVLAAQVSRAQAHQWNLVGHPVTEARWRALLASALPLPPATRSRARS